MLNLRSFFCSTKSITIAILFVLCVSFLAALTSIPSQRHLPTTRRSSNDHVPSKFLRENAHSPVKESDLAQLQLMNLHQTSPRLAESIRGKLIGPVSVLGRDGEDDKSYNFKEYTVGEFSQAWVVDRFLRYLPVYIHVHILRIRLSCKSCQRFIPYFPKKEAKWTAFILRLARQTVSGTATQYS